jgi:GLPGLI family protein
MKTMIWLLAAIVILGISSPVHAGKGKPFTGKITYTISYEGKQIDEAAESMLPKTMASYIGDGFTKNVLFTGMGKQTVIYNLETKTKTAMIDMMGQKFAIESAEEEIEKELKNLPDADIETSEETKEIAGYQCKKIVIKYKNAEGNTTSEGVAWFTGELEVSPEINFDLKYFQNLKGVLMEYEMDMGNGTMMKFTAIEVEKQKISSKEFEIPEDYKKVTREELMNSLGG